MLTAKIDKLERRDVAVLDISGAYLSADMDGEVHVVFRGTLAEMMVMYDPALYWPFLSYTSGYRKHYTAVLKAHCCSTRS